MYNYEEQAIQFCNAIRTLANKPENLNNLESYLTYNFDKWLEKWATTPENIAAEMKAFAEMEF
mgnify:CR=1 FL=1|jgi:hypothetical protein